MGLERARYTPEVTYGVYNSGGTGVPIFLPSANAMSVRPKPGMWSIKDAGFLNRLVRMNVGRTNVMGSITSYLFPSQASAWLGLATGLTGTAPCLDLPSFTLDHLIDTDSCAAIYHRYLGCKIGDFTLSCDQSDQGSLLTMKADVIASTVGAITVTDYPTDVLSAYPTDDPYLFYQTVGNLTIGGVRTDYTSLSVNIKNVVKPFSGENRNPTRVKLFGREVTLTADLLFKSDADRSAYESGAAQAVSVKFDNGTSHFKLDLGGVVKFSDVSDKFPLDDYFMQTVSVTALVDPTTGTDLTVT